ncbi:MAG: glycosyltransferase, partial [Burkholderiaceae bacterium]|nr:glycosyltransferase [Burkholderiaceae bacterium]
MRVLHIYKTYYPDTTGGVEKVLQQLVRSLATMGVESRLLVLSSDPHPAQIIFPEVTVIRCQTSLAIASNPMSVAALGEFRRQLAWADVVHYQFPWPFGDLLQVLCGGSKPSVVSYQSDIVRQKNLMRLYRPLMQRFLARSDRVCATSPSYRDTSPVLSRLQKPVDIIPNGLDAEMCPPAAPDMLQRWRAQLGEGFLLFVGVLRYYKGLHTLVEAAVGLNASVVIAGAGPEAASLQALAQQRGAKRVHFVGHITDEDKSALLQLCAGFVFPSHLRSEAFGMSLVEASMYSRPMISCEIGTGTSYVNLHGVTGLTVPPEDPVALRMAMQQLLNNPEQSQAMGRAARLRYEENFTGQRMAQSYLQVYRQL